MNNGRSSSRTCPSCPAAEDGELVPRVYWSPDRAHVSFTLAREAVGTKQARHWQEQPQSAEGHPPVPSLIGARAALYAPMLADGRVVGVIHLDTSEGGCRWAASAQTHLHRIFRTPRRPRYPRPRSVRFAMARTNSAGSTGFGMCIW